MSQYYNTYLQFGLNEAGAVLIHAEFADVPLKWK
jgi:hypothetical protein